MTQSQNFVPRLLFELSLGFQKCHTVHSILAARPIRVSPSQDQQQFERFSQFSFVQHDIDPAKHQIFMMDDLTDEVLDVELKDCLIPVSTKNHNFRQ